MKRMSILLLVLGGCASEIALAPAQEEPQEDVAQPTPDHPEPAAEPEPEPIPQLLAGTYVGTLQCHDTETVGSSTIQRDASDSETATFDSDGHLLLFGDPVRVGDTFRRGTIRFLILDITNSSNAFVYTGDVIFELPCSNTCFFAFDFVCDEIQFCNAGADCADCGPPVLEGSFDDVYQAQQDGSVRIIRNTSVLNGELALSSSSICDGILSR